MDKLIIKNRLIEIRLFRGYGSSEAAARFLGVAYSQYRQYELGKHLMRRKMLTKILDTWCISEEDFFSQESISKKSFSSHICPARLHPCAEFLLEQHKSLILTGEVEPFDFRYLFEPSKIKHVIHTRLFHILKVKDFIAQEQLNIFMQKAIHNFLYSRKHTSTKNQNLMRPIYQFNAIGEPLKRFKNLTEAMLELKMDDSQIANYINRKTFSRKGFYLSKNPNFIPPIKKANHNPLFSKKENDLLFLFLDNHYLDEEDGFY